jgi:MYXO-CTERM domain-containing protein
VHRSRPILIGSAVVAALLANYWVLEGALADRTNFDASWISDLSTRSEGSGATFVALGTLAAVALMIYGIELMVVLGGRGKLLRRGALAFFFAAVATAVAAVSPLSCAEGLEAACSLKEDPLDVVHSVATAGEIGGTILAFGLLGLGFLRGGRRRFGIATLAFGAVWLALTIVTGVSYLSDGVDEVKGAFQRIDQILFGIWLVLLAVAATSPRRGGEPAPASPAGG